MQITFPFRLDPTPEQKQLMIRTLDLCRKLYNRAKEQRDTAYNREGKTVTYAMQQNKLPAFKKELQTFPSEKQRSSKQEAPASSGGGSIHRILTILVYGKEEWKAGGIPI
ncbi:helix-turn-helix domain-containing protein [Brevibacillus sp. B_LB10_24]|uniref:helix-turn-helix domain-containing protein n=1 Tax=Brevibacillus sp. B_LB10_24 TaxID=3380645 RepID=UPI0038BB9BDC